MKTLTNHKVEVANGKLTITADIVEADPGQFKFPAQQQTVTWINPHNHAWHRHVQISNEAVFVKAFANGLAVPLHMLVEVAGRVEPKTSYPPFFRRQSDLKVEISSELEPDFQWQVSDKIGVLQSWSNIDGETKLGLDVSKVNKGQFVRLKASSEAGEMFSQGF